MPISTGDILGHSQVGVYLSVIGDVLFIPSTLEEEIAEEVESSFEMGPGRTPPLWPCTTLPSNLN